MDKVKTIWMKPCHAESVVDKIQSKLKRFKQYFKGLGFNVQGERKKLRANCRMNCWILSKWKKMLYSPLICTIGKWKYKAIS